MSNLSKFSKLPRVYFIVLCVGACALFSVKSSAQVQLAEVYNQDSTVTISDYLVSEKYDGVRAIWTGEQLLTRQGNPIPAPNWFTAPLPAVWLDGELWTQRQDFETLSSIVRTQTANDDRWRQVSYMVLICLMPSFPLSNVTKTIPT